MQMMKFDGDVGNCWPDHPRILKRRRLTAAARLKPKKLPRECILGGAGSSFSGAILRRKNISHTVWFRLVA